MKVIRFNRIRLDSANVEQACSFFEKLGGRVTQHLTRDHNDAWIGYRIQLAPGCVIDIYPSDELADQKGWKGWDHLALTVGSCEKMCELIAAAGGVVGKRPSDHVMGNIPIRNAVVRGTDGQKIELIELREDPHPDKYIIGVNHIQLNITDLERTRSFYEDVFGGQIIQTLRNEDGSAKGYMMEIAPDTVLELAPPRFPCDERQSPWHSIALEVDNVDEAVQKIFAAGGTQKVKVCNGLRDNTAIRGCVMLGPEGEDIELVQAL